MRQGASIEPRWGLRPGLPEPGKLKAEHEPALGIGVAFHVGRRDDQAGVSGQLLVPE